MHASPRCARSSRRWCRSARRGAPPGRRCRRPARGCRRRGRCHGRSLAGAEPLGVGAEALARFGAGGRGLRAADVRLWDGALDGDGAHAVAAGVVEGRPGSAGDQLEARLVAIDAERVDADHPVRAGRVARRLDEAGVGVRRGGGVAVERAGGAAQDVGGQARAVAGGGGVVAAAVRVAGGRRRRRPGWSRAGRRRGRRRSRRRPGPASRDPGVDGTAVAHACVAWPCVAWPTVPRVLPPSPPRLAVPTPPQPATIRTATEAATNRRIHRA